jgi:hypothetical protein
MILHRLIGAGDGFEQSPRALNGLFASRNQRERAVALRRQRMIRQSMHSDWIRGGKHPRP